jgi:hypothetical protein
MPPALAQPEPRATAQPPRSKALPSVVVWHVASVRGGCWLEIEATSYEAAAAKAAEVLGCCVEETVVRYKITRGGAP